MPRRPHFLRLSQNHSGEYTHTYTYIDDAGKGFKAVLAHVLEATASPTRARRVLPELRTHLSGLPGNLPGRIDNR